MTHDEWVAAGRCRAVHPDGRWCMEWERHRDLHCTERPNLEGEQIHLEYWRDDSVFPDAE